MKQYKIIVVSQAMKQLYLSSVSLLSLLINRTLFTSNNVLAFWLRVNFKRGTNNEHGQFFVYELACACFGRLNGYVRKLARVILFA